MSTKQTFKTKRIDHLGIVAGICHEIGLIAAIDQAVGPSERKVNCGSAVQAMVFNGLGFTSRALYLMLQDLDNKPVELITGQRSRRPVWMEAVSGTHSDTDCFPNTIQDCCPQVKAGDDCFLVVDSALDGAANRQRLGETRWLTRVPAPLAAANRLLAETDADEMTALPDDYASLAVPSDSGGLAQRWLVVSSPVAAQRQNKPCCAG